MTVCDFNSCAGCMLCLDVCKKNAIHIEDNLEAFNAAIDSSLCVNCNACHNKCPQNHVPEKIKPIKWYQGWNKDKELRGKAPSGGVGTALIFKFIEDGGYVCSCLFQNGEFVFDITDDKQRAIQFGGSKYVKSNPKGIYNKILELLKADNKVLFIGLPCQVAALKNYVGDKYLENLYLVDLICHGTPSPKTLDIFLNQYNKSLDYIKTIAFRIKSRMQIVTDDSSVVCQGVSDKYTIGFYNGLIFTENCYSCNYASIERVSDITIGDSWGSELLDEQKAGISLMIIQTKKGMKLIEESNIELREVDLNNAVSNNGQLNHPMKQPLGRNSFFEGIQRKKFNTLIFRLNRKQCLKQDIKFILIKLGIVKL